MKINFTNTKHLKFLLITTLIAVKSVNLLAQENHSYPKITGFVGILHPIITINNSGAHYNFSENYVVGMPTGINIWKTKNVGFSMELVPFIKAENGTSKMYNLLFHPGILLRLADGFTFAGRIAFETSGRYGVTPVFNKVIKRNKLSSYYIAVPIPARFGNNLPNSIGTGVQFGIAF